MFRNHFKNLKLKSAGITLSPEQIMPAPPEVRRRVEQQVGSGLKPSRPALTSRDSVYFRATRVDGRAAFANCCGVIPYQRLKCFVTA